jgi:D-serine deaminase-like pyridoxal phosphate-dependent protein
MKAELKTPENIYSMLDTPAVIIDMDKLELNIQEMTHTAKEAKLKLRPHVKIHQCPEITKMQIDAGACGIEVGNIEQATVMANEGISDIVIAHPFWGVNKLEKLKVLLNKTGLKLSIVIDMFEQALALSHIGQELNIRIPVLMKIDTGINRFGVPPGEPALNMALDLLNLDGSEFTGIYAHESGAIPTQEGVDRMAFQVATVMCETANIFREKGISIKDVSVGASPTFRSTCRYIRDHHFPEITEIHPGACVIGDITYMMGFGNSREACALSILTSVMSTSQEDHVVIDAGFKTLGADSIIGRRDVKGFFWKNMPSFCSFRERTDLWLGKLGAESGWLYYKDSKNRLVPGERLEIIPNNAALVLNLHDRVYGVRKGIVEREFIISGRGEGS